MRRSTIIIPCYNEEARLVRERFEEFMGSSQFHLIFVNDGSSDGTPRVLEELWSLWPDRVTVMHLEKNAGKAEAVRLGLVLAMKQGAPLLGYLDADLAAPFSEAVRLFSAMGAIERQVILGIRSQEHVPGVKRSRWRRWWAQWFHRFAARCLGHEFLDTQCGVKVFREGAALRAALREPFRSRWVFDVELLGRLLTGPTALSRDTIAELPLQHWTEMSGSKLRWRDAVRLPFDMWRVWRDLARRRRTVSATKIGAVAEKGRG